MDTKLYIARQSIFDTDGNIAGYEFFYRDSDGNSNIIDYRQATASVLWSILNQLGSYRAFGNIDAFINIDESILLTDIISILPSKQFIFEISSSIQITRQTIDVIEYYHSQGYRFALDNASFNTQYLDKFAPLIRFVEFVKFDTTQVDIEQFSYSPHPFSQKKLIAQKIEFSEMADAYKELGFNYLQGFYLGGVETIIKNKIEPKTKEIVDLFGKLQVGVEKEALADTFKNNSSLMLQFLQFVTSSKLEQLRNSTSVLDIIDQFEQKDIASWLLLIIYSKSSSRDLDSENSYAVAAKNRLDIMYAISDEMSEILDDAELKENIYCMGIISLLDNIMGLDVGYFKEASGEDNEIFTAIISGSGVLGSLLKATIAIENSDTQSATNTLSEYGVKPSAIEAITARLHQAI